MLAAPSITVPSPIFVSPKPLPDTMPFTVKLPAPPIELLAYKVTVPLTVAALLLSPLIMAPALAGPVPKR